MTSLSAYASRAEIYAAFLQQFSQEFYFPVWSQPDDTDFNFRREWELIYPRVEHLELGYPILNHWKEQDFKWQTYWL